MKVTFFTAVSAFILTLLFASCQTSLVDDSQMIGKWECVNIETKGENPPLKSIFFDFKSDSTYHYYSANNPKGQKGSWYTLNDVLYTTPQDGKKMGVKLGLNSPDTLLFYQNRGGKPETWTMVRRSGN